MVIGLNVCVGDDFLFLLIVSPVFYFWYDALYDSLVNPNHLLNNNLIML